jgi:hypothetical protein
MGLGTALSAGLVATLASALPAMAGPAPNAPPANPVICSGAYTIANLTTPGFTCYNGDKQYYDFAFSFGTSGGSFLFTQNGAQNTFSGAGLTLNPGNFSYGYSIALFNPPPGQQMNQFITAATGTSVVGGLGSTATLSTADGSITNPDNATSTSTNGAQGNLVSFDSGVTAAIFSGGIGVSSGTITTLSNTIVQEIAPPTGDSVPGPLPIMGAAGAFAYSRRIRRRIKFAA